MPREYRTRALVLRSSDWGESDRIVHLYTEELGRVSAIAKGALRSRRRFPGVLELFSLLDARLVDPPRSSMLRLEAARLSRPIEGLTDSLARFAVGCHFLELLDRITGEGEAHPGMFPFARGVLEVLSREQPDRLFALLLLAKTLARLGYRPQLSACVECGAPLRGRVGFAPAQGGGLCPRCTPEGTALLSARVLDALERGIRTPLSRRGELGLSRQDVDRLEREMLGFFRFHIGIELRSAEFLRGILASRQLDGPLEHGDTPRARAKDASGDPEPDGLRYSAPARPPAPEPGQEAVELGESQAPGDPERPEDQPQTPFPRSG